ncbi:MAG TPA: putative quinol monooxygenase [Pyrinomonadaceae bacterium]
MSIRVVAHITAKPEKVDETRELLLSLIEPTRVEEGCVTYELMQNTADPTDFTFVEEWTSDAALDAHLETEHLKRAAARGAELFAGPPDIRRYRFVA